MAQEPMAPVDVAWLRMDRPSNPMVINAIVTFNAPMAYEDWKAVIEERLLRYPRFRQRVRNIATSPYWEDDPDFDINLHIHRVSLPPPADQKELQDLVGDLMSHPMDFTRPPWQMYLVENYRYGSAVVARLHHCIGDGIALVRVFLNMADEYYDPCHVPPGALKPRTSLLNLVPDFLQPAARLVATGVETSARLLETGLDLVTHPEKILQLAQQGLDVGKAVGKIALIPPDSRTIFKGRVGPKKVAAWGKPVPLDTLKAIGKPHGAKVNDVAVALVTAALRRYLLEEGEDPSGVNIRVLIPVNLRPPEQAETLGNRFGLVFLDLPLGIEDPLERLMEVHRRMDALKHSAEPAVALGILYALGLSPRKELQDLVVNLLSLKATAVMSNVPGPQEPLHFAGRPLRNAMFWVPQGGNIGMGLSIMSFNRKVLFGVMTDARIVREPHRIADYFMDAFEDYRKRFAPRARGIITNGQHSRKKKG